MADEVARLVAVMEANIKGFTKGMDQAQRLADRRFGQIERRMAKTESVFANSFKGIGRFLVGGAALAGITRFVSSVSDAVGKLQDTSDSIGISTDLLQTLGIVAGRSGVKQEELNKALSSFAQRLGEAQIRGGPFAKFLNGIGVGTKGNVQDVLLRISDAVKATSSQQQKAAIVAEALGARYVRLVPLFEQGADGLAQLNAEFSRNGQIIGRELIAKIDELGDKWEDLKKQFTVIGANVLGGIADEFSSFSADFTDPEFQAALRDFGKILADAAIAVAKIGAGIGSLAGFLGFTSGDQITELRKVIEERKALVTKFKLPENSLVAQELKQAEAAYRRLLAEKAERSGLGSDFSIPTRAPSDGIDRTGQLQADDAKQIVDKTFADLAAAQAELARATGEANAVALSGTKGYYDAVRKEARDSANAAIIAAEEKKKAEIAALDETKIGHEAYRKAISNIEQTTAAEQAALLEKRRGEIARANREEYEQALNLSRQLSDLNRDSLEQRLEAERRAQTSRSELEIAKEQAKGGGLFDPGGDSDAVLELKRQLIEETAKLEEQEIEERLARNLQSLEREKEDLARRGEDWAEYERARVDATAEAEAQIEDIRTKRTQEQVEIDEQANKQREDNLRDTLGTIAGLTRSSNDTLRALGKAAAIAQATIDGIVAVQKALASAPPPFNFALAALVGAATAANVAEIAAMEKGGRVQAGTPYIVGEKRPELFVPDTAGRIIPRVPNIAEPKMGSINGGTLTINAPIDARGAQIGVAEQISAAMARTTKDIERRFPRLMIKAQRDNL